MRGMAAVVLLIVGIHLSAYAAGTPGDQWPATIAGGAALGLFVSIIEGMRKGKR